MNKSGFFRVRRIEEEEYETIDGQTGRRLCIREVDVNDAMYRVDEFDFGTSEIAYLTEEWIICPPKAAKLHLLAHTNPGEKVEWRLAPFQNGAFRKEL